MKRCVTQVEGATEKEVQLKKVGDMAHNENEDDPEDTAN